MCQIRLNYLQFFLADVTINKGLELTKKKPFSFFLGVDVLGVHPNNFLAPRKNSNVACLIGAVCKYYSIDFSL